MEHVTPEEKRALLGDNIDEWRCPKCGALAYTHKSQGALMVKCASDHGKALVWMQRVVTDNRDD